MRLSAVTVTKLLENYTKRWGFYHNSENEIQPQLAWRICNLVYA